MASTNRSQSLQKLKNEKWLHINEEKNKKSRFPTSSSSSSSTVRSAANSPSIRPASSIALEPFEVPGQRFS